MAGKSGNNFGREYYRKLQEWNRKRRNFRAKVRITPHNEPRRKREVKWTAVVSGAVREWNLSRVKAKE